jgi:hypothetical protein
MAARKGPAKVDPELERQINAASAEAKTVEAVLMLRQSPAQISANARGTTEIVESVLKRVKEKAGTGAKQVNVFQNLGMFIVEAEPSFLRELVAQPEIASAVANRQPGEAMMPPVTKPATKAPTRQKAGSVKRAGQRGRARAATAKQRK